MSKRLSLRIKDRLASAGITLDADVEKNLCDDISNAKQLLSGIQQLLAHSKDEILDLLNKLKECSSNENFVNLLLNQSRLEEMRASGSTKCVWHLASLLEKKDYYYESCLVHAGASPRTPFDYLSSQEEYKIVWGLLQDVFIKMNTVAHQEGDDHDSICSDSDDSRFGNEEETQKSDAEEEKKERSDEIYSDEEQENYFRLTYDENSPRDEEEEPDPKRAKNE